MRDLIASAPHHWHLIILVLQTGPLLRLPPHFAMKMSLMLFVDWISEGQCALCRQGTILVHARCTSCTALRTALHKRRQTRQLPLPWLCVMARYEVNAQGPGLYELQKIGMLV